MRSQPPGKTVLCYCLCFLRYNSLPGFFLEEREEEEAAALDY